MCGSSNLNREGLLCITIHNHHKPWMNTNAGLLTACSSSTRYLLQLLRFRTQIHTHRCMGMYGLRRPAGLNHMPTYKLECWFVCLRVNRPNGSTQAEHTNPYVSINVRLSCSARGKFESHQPKPTQLQANRANQTKHRRLVKPKWIRFHRLCCPQGAIFKPCNETTSLTQHKS